MIAIMAVSMGIDFCESVVAVTSVGKTILHINTSTTCELCDDVQRRHVQVRGSHPVEHDHGGGTTGSSRPASVLLWRVDVIVQHRLRVLHWASGKPISSTAIITATDHIIGITVLPGSRIRFAGALSTECLLS
jgi:hypothetical protein